MNFVDSCEIMLATKLLVMEMGNVMKGKIYFVYFDGNNSYLTWCHLGYIVSAIERMKYTEVVVRNVNHDNLYIIIEEIIKERPKMLILATKYKTYKIAQEFIRLTNQKIHHICMCYTLPTNFPDRVLIENPEVDSVLIGEVENTIGDLIECVLTDRDYKHCNGIGYLEQGEVRINPAGEMIFDLDKLSFPERKGFPTDKKFFHVIGSRGCDGNCSFCSMNDFYKTHTYYGQRFRSVSNLVSEIDELVEKYDCKYAGISDSTYCKSINGSVDVTRLRELYVELSKREYHIEFFINMRAEQVSAESIFWLDKLNEIGLSRVFIGLESWNQTDLKLYNKIASVSINRKAVELIGSYLKKNNDRCIDFEYGFICFHPFSTLESIIRNVEEHIASGNLLTPKMLLSKLEVNHNTKMEEIVAAAGLCDSEPNLYSKSVKYKFANDEVLQLYNFLESKIGNLNDGFSDALPVLVNRYIYFFGVDTNVKDVLETNEYYKKIRSEYLLFVFCDLIKEKGITANTENVSEISIDQVTRAQKDCSNKFRRIIIELKRIDQLSYY